MTVVWKVIEMKILIVAWKIDNKNIEGLRFTYTGGALAINNIAEYIGRREEVYVFVGINEMPEITVGNFKLIQTNDIPADIREELHRGCDDVNELRLRDRAYAFEKCLLECKPDLVHFHDIGDLTQRLMPICDKYGVIYCITNHLLIGKKPDYPDYDAWSKREDDFYLNNIVNTTLVSTGQRPKFFKNFPNYPNDKVVSIVNGTDYSRKSVVEDIRKKHNIKASTKILLCTGSLIGRKNQEQIIKSLALVKQDVMERTVVILCGKGKNTDYLSDLSKRHNLENRIILTGPIEPEIMPSYYHASDAYIMPSKAEGLSLSALEAISFGKPVILFSDSECFNDLFDDGVVCFAESRTDQAFADTIERWFYRKWDSNHIKTFSKYFTLERMADDYIKYYRSLLMTGDEDVK